MILYAVAILFFTLAGSLYFILEMSENSKMETNLDEYMPRNHPAFMYSDSAEEWFSIKDGILIAIENHSGIYNYGSLQKIKEITLGLQGKEGFDENDIMSLYSADNIIGTADGMEVESFYTSPPETDEELNSLREKVSSNDMVYRRLISEDATVALVVAGMNDSTFSNDFYTEILAFAKSFEGEGDKIYVAGRPIVEGTLALLGPADMKRMVPIVLAVISLVLLILLRSFRATIATLLSVFISTIWAFGLMAATGIPIYSVSTMIPVMLIAIGVAYGIYYYNHISKFYQHNPNKHRTDAILYVNKVLWKPLSMAAFTTIIGFVSLVSSQVYPIKYFGLFTAFGIFVSYLLTLLLIPAFAMIFGFKTRSKKIKEIEIDMVKKNRVTDFLLDNRSWVYGIFLIIIALSFFGLSRIWINSSFLDKFEKDSEIVITDAFVNSKFGGTSSLNVILQTQHTDAFKEPENLRLIDSLQQDVNALQEVGNSFSLADYLKRMNKVMNEDQSNFYVVPESSPMVAQYLLLYEMSGDPQNLSKVVNYDYNRTNITLQLKGDDSKTINAALEIIEKYRPQFEKQGIELNYAGSGYKALVFSDLILEGQIISILISFLMVLILLILMFKSVKAGLIGSIPIIITALISFGVMGLFDIPLSTTTALLSSIAIGIGIDYAIHFIENYKKGIETLTTRHAAIHQTMNYTGRAILFNAVVVIAGFLVLLFSVFPPNRILGALVSMNMFTSFAGTLSIMMILLYKSKVFIKKNG